ncbi:serine/threonine-protein kinase [Streptosporangium sp. NPDC004379]|uniref:serine/threonine-protein kinase n=1 Tax=Streptosporangium sp. NPDC004379 TaxID=3366189 RepID=UPI0036A43D6C
MTVNNLESGDSPHIGRYRVLRPLGRGGMGTVYLGESPEGRQVAIKVINPEYTRHEQFRMRFRREAEAARRVRRFCTAAVIEADLDGDQLYVVTEYVAGPNLEEAVRAQGPLFGSSLDALAVGVATALTSIHGAGIVHRDLKPSNVLLSSLGPRVIDFGIARALDTLSGITGTGEIIGTPRYMAPEVLRGERVSPACDVFSWGCLMAFAASGRPPFGGDSLPSVMYQVLNTDPALEGMEPALRELVARALVKDPERRPTAQQILDHLIGRSAEPEQAARSVRTVWQQDPQVTAPGAPQPTAPWPGTAEPRTAPWPGAAPGGPGASGGHHAPGLSAGPGASGGPGGPGGPGFPGWPGAPGAPGGHAVPERSAVPGGQVPGRPEEWTAQETRAGGPGGAPPAGPAGPPAARGGRTGGRLRLAVAATAALVVAGGTGLYFLLSPSGPPDDLPLLYQDDFTQSTNWDSSEYDPPTRKWGYSHEGYIAIDVDGEDAGHRMDAPIPFVTAPPATPAPSASPTPVVPTRLLVGVDVRIRGGSGPGDYGVFCRGDKDNLNATRYEFLLDTSGKARIRKTIDNAGGELAAPAEVDLPKGEAARVQAECADEGESGVRLTMWVNGRRVQTARDGTPLPNGSVGVFARVAEKGRATLKTSFDNFTLNGPLPPKGSAGKGG